MFCPAFNSSISFGSSNILSGGKAVCSLSQYPNTWYVTGRDVLSSEDQVNRNTIEEEPLRRWSCTSRHPVPVCG